jgi:hypothetical protein
MRSHLPYIVSLLLLWIWSPSPVIAQSLGPKSPQSIQPLPQKALSDTKPLAFQKASKQSKQISFMDTQGKPRLLAPSQNFMVMEDTPESAHILVWQAPPDMDQSMILEIPKDFSSNMPIVKGLPPSSADFRGVFINQPPQSANPLFAPDARKHPN